MLKEFEELIEQNTRIHMLMSSMFEELPKKKPYNDEPTGEHPQIRDYQHMLQLLNHSLTEAPKWTDKAHEVGMVGLPINALLDWPMGTPSGYALFLDPTINAMLKKILNAWGKFLSSPESAKQVVHEDTNGWFQPHGRSALEKVSNEAASQNLKFHQIFKCDTSKPHYGFTSWDDYFTRHFREDVRPVASPDDDNVIANACESKPYNVARNIKLRDKFWAKGQPYSAYDMLADDELAKEFEGGTVYQAFLSALSYHRWHSPVSGKVKKAFVKDGTYYSEPLFENIGDPEKARKGDASIDMGGETTSQGYLTAMATRAIIFIEADNPAIGLCAFIGIGMSEVSTCEATVKEGQHLKKGDEIGMFHFGGSTHCLMFRKGVQVDGFPQPGRESNVPLRSKLAVVSKS